MNNKHGMSQSRFYQIWEGMKARCYRKTCNGFKQYSEKGIKVCDRWHKFSNFQEDMYAEYLEHCLVYGEKDTTLDRIDNSKNYEKSNCRWTTVKIQLENRGGKYYGHLLKINNFIKSGIFKTIKDVEDYIEEFISL